jgi:hypothetical protein
MYRSNFQIECVPNVAWTTLEVEAITVETRTEE